MRCPWDEIFYPRWHLATESKSIVLSKSSTRITEREKIDNLILSLEPWSLVCILATNPQDIYHVVSLSPKEISPRGLAALSGKEGSNVHHWMKFDSLVPKIVGVSMSKNWQQGKIGSAPFYHLKPMALTALNSGSTASCIDSGRELSAGPSNAHWSRGLIFFWWSRLDKSWGNGPKLNARGKKTYQKPDKIWVWGLRKQWIILLVGVTGVGERVPMGPELVTCSDDALVLLQLLQCGISPYTRD